jgi:NAD-dependent deacetylase
VLDAVVTQNIDMLHRKAGTQRLIEVHGTIEASVCLRCGNRYPLADVRERLSEDPAGIPRCDCCAPLKPGVVLFGEMLPAGAMEEATELAERADVLLCVGSSLEVWPVAGLVEVAARAGGAVAIATQGPTPFDDIAAVKLTGDVVEELAAVLAAI